MKYFTFPNNIFKEQLIDVQDTLNPPGNHVQFIYPFAFELQYSESLETSNERLYKGKYIKSIQLQTKIKAVGFLSRVSTQVRRNSRL